MANWRTSPACGSASGPCRTRIPVCASLDLTLAYRWRSSCPITPKIHPQSRTCAFTHRSFSKSVSHHLHFPASSQGISAIVSLWRWCQTATEMFLGKHVRVFPGDLNIWTSKQYGRASSNSEGPQNRSRSRTQFSLLKIGLSRARDVWSFVFPSLCSWNQTYTIIPLSVRSSVIEWIIL